MNTPHGARKHSKFSASGAERYFNCPGSVELSEGLPDKDSVWSLEGTRAHEVMERLMRGAIQRGAFKVGRQDVERFIPYEMAQHAVNAANFILGIHHKTEGSEVLVETRISLPFIHPDMFGTFDGAVVEHFGTLHVFDFKYGAGHAVSPGTTINPNLQMVFYGLGLAGQYDWNFNKVRLWIIQPRIRGYQGPTCLDLTIEQIRKQVEIFKRAVRRVEEKPDLYVEGTWCHFCKAKSKCPLKTQGRLEKARSVFLDNPA